MTFGLAVGISTVVGIGLFLGTKIFKISRFMKHLSDLQSKQHEVQFLQQLLHTYIHKTKK